MKTSTRLAIEAEIKAAREIFDAAERQDRDLTVAERGKVEEHVAKADQIRQTSEEAAAFLKNLGDTLGDGLGVEPRAGNSGYVPSTKAHPGRSWGEAVLRANGGAQCFKALTPSGAVLVDVPAPQPVPLGQPVLSLRQVIPSEQSSGRFSYLKQTVRVNNAAPVAEGALKPTSDYQLVPVEDYCRTIAHLAGPVSRQSMSDAPTLQAFVQSEMFFGVERALEAEIINGDGTGEHMIGLNNVSGALTVAYATSLTTTTRKAQTALENQGLTPNAYVLNPVDYEAIELAATSTGSLLMAEAGQGSPVNAAARRLWGTPVVATPSCPLGTGFLVDFATSTKLYIREGVSLTWSENVYDPDALGAGVGASDFSRNMIRWRAEMRAGWAILRPSAVAKIDLTP